MALDNSPRIRQKAKLARKRATRQTFERVLIVTEGTKTEPLYFADIRQSLRLSSTHIDVVPSSYGTDPVQIVQFAEDRVTMKPDVERVFCVFDRDEHLGFHDALAMTVARNKKWFNDDGVAIQFEAIHSVPCFEYWLLLHFEEAFAFMERDEALARLKACMVGYEKGGPNVFSSTRDRLPAALERAARGIARSENGADNPLTRVGVLVDYLLKIKN